MINLARNHIQQCIHLDVNYKVQRLRPGVVMEYESPAAVNGQERSATKEYLQYKMLYHRRRPCKFFVFLYQTRLTN
jgi:hypothetical protein